MALNDWADRAEDAVDRPHRPLPSGRIAPAAALAAAGGLTAAGLALAARAGRPARVAVAALAATVWAYDLDLKHTPAGPAAMACARSLDLLLGAAAAAAPAPRALRRGTRRAHGGLLAVHGRATGWCRRHSAARSARAALPSARSARRATRRPSPTVVAPRRGRGRRSCRRAAGRAARGGPARGRRGRGGAAVPVGADRTGTARSRGSPVPRPYRRPPRRVRGHRRPAPVPRGPPPLAAAHASGPSAAGSAP